jgi:hypothetical protein
MLMVNIVRGAKRSIQGGPYVAPLGNAVRFNFQVGYTAPAGNAVVLNLR